MKKLIIIAVTALFLLSAGFAQSFDIASEVQPAFQAFSDDVAVALPFMSSIGLTRSEPNPRLFSVGVSAGAVTIPADAFNQVADTFGITLPEAITGADVGVPLPAYTVEAKVNLPVIPTIGVKVGYLTPDITRDLTGGDFGVDYLLAGADVTVPIIKGNLILPSLDVTAGFNYLSGAMSMPVDTAGYTVTTDYGDIGLSDAELVYAWEAKVLDLKLQASKGLLFFRPYAGLGYSYSMATAGGGFNAVVSSTLTDAELELLQEAYGLEIEDNSFLINSEANGHSFRAYGGVGINLLLLRLDLNVLYGFQTKTLGGGITASIGF
jgi:hypothetical protein